MFNCSGKYFEIAKVTYMDYLGISLILSILFCTLVSWFIFTYSGSFLHIQKLNIEEPNDKTLAYEGKNFEAKWNFFNKIRTFVAISASSLLLIVLSLR